MKKILIILIAFTSTFASLEIQAKYKYNYDYTLENTDKLWEGYDCSPNQIFFSELGVKFFSDYSRLSLRNETQEVYMGFYLFGFMEEFEDLADDLLDISMVKKSKTVEFGDLVFYLGGDNDASIIKVEHRKKDVTNAFNFNAVEGGNFFRNFNNRFTINFNAFSDQYCYFVLDQI